jgi:hypothetical protein
MKTTTVATKNILAFGSVDSPKRHTLHGNSMHEPALTVVVA